MWSGVNSSCVIEHDSFNGSLSVSNKHSVIFLAIIVFKLRNDNSSKYSYVNSLFELDCECELLFELAFSLANK